VLSHCANGKDVTEANEMSEGLRTNGLVIHWAARYDFLAWLLTRGREGAFRERLLALAALKPGESVLDIGCGTGTLAIAATRHVGPTGAVHGIDASRPMITRATRKASKAGVRAVFHVAAAERLPFPDARFDIVLSTLMLHHLPRKTREQCAVETRRVLRPGGRVLAVDFGRAQAKRGLLAHFHRHGHVSIEGMEGVFTRAGLRIVRSGPVGFRDLQFVVAEVARDPQTSDSRTGR
jgi:ubiquinone/menaquinone biosynthesis C-methylase UbiE